MAIVSTQRPAIEQLVERTVEPTSTIELYTLVEKTKLQLSDGTPLYFLGISEGQGIYSNHRGMKVLCLGLEQPKNHRQITIPPCDYAVLLRDPTKEERPDYQNDNLRACVELLTIESVNEETVTFRPTGEISLYVPM